MIAYRLVVCEEHDDFTTQDFTSLDACLSEARKYLDPEKLAASWVRITRITVGI